MKEKKELKRKRGQNSSSSSSSSSDHLRITKAKRTSKSNTISDHHGIDFWGDDDGNRNFTSRLNRGARRISRSEKVAPETFKAITARGKTRPKLDRDAQKALVTTKMQYGQNLDYGILFRINDKKKIKSRSNKSSTVQGPNWTPSSSIGFVGGLTDGGKRVYSVTDLTEENLIEKNKPSILARELSEAVLRGYTIREPEDDETIPIAKGERKKSKIRPSAILSPPDEEFLSDSETSDIERDIFNPNNNDFSSLPISLGFRKGKTPFEVFGESRRFTKRSKKDRRSSKRLKK